LDVFEPEIPPRRRRRRRRRTGDGRPRKGRAKKIVAGTIAALVVGSATVGITTVLDRAATEEDHEPTAAPAVVGGVGTEGTITTLLYGTREEAPELGAVWITLLSVDPRRDRAAVIYVPAHTAVEVPGRGLLPLGQSVVSGGPALLLVSAENLLGVPIDRYIELSDSDSRVLFEATGPLTVDVPAEVRVPAGPDQARLIFVDGPQELSAPFLERLLYTRGLDTDDVEFGTRLLAFWDALLDNFADDQESLGDAIRSAGPALLSDASLQENVAFFEAMTRVPDNDIVITAIPVRAISAGDSELYGTEPDELAQLLSSTVGSRAEKADEVRVQILNGNGEPGIGQEVAERLVGEGFRIILSGNAQSLDYETTLIVTYDSSARGQALADRARELLGVGEVQVSAQQQGIVDLTIVVGKDFLRAP
ncbi:MAG: LCP family protein, partial [Actinomycetota bacterium]|nr:LCP family protein [Actinomycetota bacterium]